MDSPKDTVKLSTLYNYLICANVRGSEKQVLLSRWNTSIDIFESGRTRTFSQLKFSFEYLIRIFVFQGHLTFFSNDLNLYLTTG